MKPYFNYLRLILFVTLLLSTSCVRTDSNCNIHYDSSTSPPSKGETLFLIFESIFENNTISVFFESDTIIYNQQITTDRSLGLALVERIDNKKGVYKIQVDSTVCTVKNNGKHFYFVVNKKDDDLSFLFSNKLRLYY